MKLKELKKLINELPTTELEREVTVKIHGVYATEPHVIICKAYLGFDWSHGFFMLVPEKELTIRMVKKEHESQ